MSTRENEKRAPYARRTSPAMGRHIPGQENATTGRDSSGIDIHKARPTAASEKASRAARMKASADRERREAEEQSARPVIRHRPGTLEEVTAITPTHALDLLMAIWRSNPRRCPTCGR